MQTRGVLQRRRHHPRETLVRRLGRRPRAAHIPARPPGRAHDSNDFISGALGSELAERVVPELAHFLREFRGDKIFTRDTHDDDYLDTREGRCLPTIHARRNSDGWRLHPDVDAARKPGDLVIDKSAYGCVDLIPAIRRKRYRRIYVVGYDTEYCVLSNAVIARAADSEAEVRVIESLCGYADRDAHDVAVEAMLTLNVEIL